MKYPSMSILNYRHLIFDKEAKKTHAEEKKRSSEMVLGKLNVHTQKNEVKAIYITMYKS